VGDDSRKFIIDSLTPITPPRSLDELKRALALPLPPLPVHPAHILPNLAETKHVFASVGHPDVSASFGKIFRPNFKGGSEIELAHFYAGLLHDPLEYAIGVLGVSVVSGRNRVDPSAMTVTSLRPDYCLWAQKLLVFKAEDKSDAAELADAIADLRRKTSAYHPLTCGQIPFLLANAAAGDHLQFFAIDMRRGEVARLTDVLVLTHAVNGCRDRLKAVTTMLNIARVIVSWHANGLLRDPVHQLFATISRARGAEITFMQDHLVKRWRPVMEQVELAALFAVAGASRYLIRLVPGSELRFHKDGSVGASLQPVGDPRLPADVTELRSAVRCVLRALSALHSAGFVHRDVRWDNVVSTPDSAEWILVDLDTAARVGTPPTWYNPSFPPGYERGERLSTPWTAAFDLYQLSEMIGSMILSLVAQDERHAWGELRSHLRSCNSADAALKHPLLT
jgi:hypothetical protein